MEYLASLKRMKHVLARYISDNLREPKGVMTEEGGYLFPLRCIKAQKL